LNWKKKKYQHVGISRFDNLSPALVNSFDVFYITITGDNFIKKGRKPGHQVRASETDFTKCICGRRKHLKGFIATGIPIEEWSEVIDTKRMFKFNLNMTDLFSDLVESCRREFGKETAYFRAFELQKRMAGHAHFLMAIPRGKATEERLKEKIASVSLNGVKWGSSVDIQKIKAKNNESIKNTVCYITKYLTKDAVEEKTTRLRKAQLIAEGKTEELKRLTQDEKTAKAYDAWLKEELKYYLKFETDTESVGRSSRNFGMGNLVSASRNWSDTNLKILDDKAKAWAIGARQASEDDKVEVRPARSEVNGRIRDDRDRCDTLGGASGRQEDIIKHRSLERVSGVSLETAGEPSEATAKRASEALPLISIEKSPKCIPHLVYEHEDLENSKPFLRDLFTGEKIFKPDSG
jgi:hypothetical protein